MRIEPLEKERVWPIYVSPSKENKIFVVNYRYIIQIFIDFYI